MNAESDAERMWITSGIRHVPDLQNASTSSQSHVVASNDAECDCRPSQPADEVPPADPSAELSSYEMYASPLPSDCLNSDIWLSSAAVDLGSPLMLRGSGSYTFMHRGT